MMNTKTVILRITVIMAMSCLLLSCAEEDEAAQKPARELPVDWPETLIVGNFTGNDTDESMAEREVIREFLSERLGITVKMQTGTSYSVVIEAMRNKHIHCIAVGPFSYILAVEEANAEALAVSITTLSDDPKVDPELPPHYYSVIFTKKGSGIESLGDLKGTNFNFVDPASTSGHLFPKTFLMINGITPGEDMDISFAGGHVASVLSVWNDSATAGATLEQNLYRLSQEGMIKFCGFNDNQIGKKRSPSEVKALYEACPKGHLTIIAFTDPIPRTPFAIRRDMPESLKVALKEALLDVQNHPEIVAKSRRWYIDPTIDYGVDTVDAFYNPVREVAKLLDMDLKALGE